MKGVKENIPEQNLLFPRYKICCTFTRFRKEWNHLMF